MFSTNHDQKPADQHQKRFHDHLDDCDQCRNNPFGLCPRGLTLLMLTPEREQDSLNL